MTTAFWTIYCHQQWCRLRPSVLGQDRSETKKNQSWSCMLWSWSYTLQSLSWCWRSGVVLWNTILWRSSSGWYNFRNGTVERNDCVSFRILRTVIGRNGTLILTHMHNLTLTLTLTLCLTLTYPSLDHNPKNNRNLCGTPYNCLPCSGNWS